MMYGQERFIETGFTMNTLEGKKVLVTGATGLIGKTLVRKLLSLHADVVCSVRNIKKAEDIFSDTDHLSFIIGDIKDLPLDDYQINYIIHAASETASKAFVDRPVDVIETAVSGTRRILEFARINHSESIVYLSSMEVYGAPETDDPVFETAGTNLDTMSVRSCYPESKRLCESLCASYHHQYNVPVKVVRLTQTFGPGVSYSDPRVFAEFARCAIERKDIVLHSSGATRRNYLYTDDAVAAILTVLMKGTDGEAYNAANEDTYCSILDMANLVAHECAGGEISVIVENDGNISKYGYAPTLKMNLNTSKLQALGWHPTVPLKEMFEKMIKDMRNQTK